MNIIENIVNGNFRKTLFDNGLTIVSEFVPYIGSFSAGICINKGSRDDWKGKAGISHFMEHAAFRHTKNRTSKRIANDFEDLGAYSNAFTTKEITCFYARSISQYFSKVFELLADITINTVFIEREIEKEKLIILEEIKSYEDDPEEYICDISDTVAFAGTRLAIPIVGTLYSVNNITYKDLEKFHDEFYISKNITIAVAGSIEHSSIVDAVIKYFPDIFDNSSADINRHNEQSITPNFVKKRKVHRDIQQSHLMLLINTKGIRDKERYPLAITNIMFGEGMSSRLYQNLREKYGIAYSIYSSVQNYIGCGVWSIYAATDNKKTQNTIDLIYKEMENFASDKTPTLKELNRAKQQLKTATIIEQESMSSRMQNLIKQEISIGKQETIQEVISSIDAVTLNDIMDITDIYFKTEQWKQCLLLPNN